MDAIHPMYNPQMPFFLSVSARDVAFYTLLDMVSIILSMKEFPEPLRRNWQMRMPDNYTTCVKLPTTVTSQLARWRLKSPVSRLFTQPFFFRRRSKKTSKLHVTGLCEGNSPVTGAFPAQRASNAKNDSIWWRHHTRVMFGFCYHLPSLHPSSTAISSVPVIR